VFTLALLLPEERTGEKWKDSIRKPSFGNWQQFMGKYFKALAWLRQLLVGLLQQRPVFSPRSSFVGFVLADVTCGGQAFL
jgi:hypothetical protein